MAAQSAAEALGLIVSPVLLIDTDILINAARMIPDAVQFLEKTESEGTLGISVITEMEIVAGCRDKKELRKLDKFLKRFQILPVQAAISSQASHLLRTYNLSHGLLIPDAVIAATAIENSLVLATLNTKDFRFIDGLTLTEYPEASQ